VTAQTGVAGLLLLPLAAAQLPVVPVRDWAWLILLGIVFTGHLFSRSILGLLPSSAAPEGHRCSLTR